MSKSIKYDPRASMTLEKRKQLEAHQDALFQVPDEQLEAYLESNIRSVPDMRKALITLIRYVKQVK